MSNAYQSQLLILSDSLCIWAIKSGLQFSQQIFELKLSLTGFCLMWVCHRWTRSALPAHSLCSHKASTTKKKKGHKWSRGNQLCMTADNQIHKWLNSHKTKTCAVWTLYSQNKQTVGCHKTPHMEQFSHMNFGQFQDLIWDISHSYPFLRCSTEQKMLK